VRDFAPTWMELAGLRPHEEMTGKSLANIIHSEKSGWIEDRKMMLVAKERHDLGRPNDWGYPVRAIRTPEFLYSHNFNPERWPVCNPETGLGNCDDGPTKSWIVENKGAFYDLCFGYRPEEEFFNIKDDPQCLKNLAGNPQYAAQMKTLRDQLDKTLREEKDPRALGNGAIFDTYKYVGNSSKGYDAWLARQQGKLPPEPEKKGKKKKADE
jgi:N-sulfoglucosamine sulfohydrolase